MNLDEAVYESVTGFIFGVRGQWIYKCSATDGSVLDSQRFTANAYGDTSITALGGKLYCGVRITPLSDFYNGTDLDRDVFIVDAATFTVTGRLNIGTDFASTNNVLRSGYKSMTNDGTHLSGYNMSNGSPAIQVFGVFDADPSNFAATKTNGAFNFCDDICYDSFNNVYWIADSMARLIWVSQTHPIKGGLNYSYNNGLSAAQNVHGITYNLAQNKVYAVTGTEEIYTANAADAMPGYNHFNLTSIHTGHFEMNPIRIKSVNDLAGNPLNGKVLIPTWDGDTVLVWDPATDTVEDTKTGFSSPIDIVVCPTVNFAVQTSSTGLVLIT